MHAILSIDVPDINDYQLSQQMICDASGFLRLLAKTEPSASEILRLGEYVWQIDLNKSYSFLAALTAEASRFGISYKILFLDQEPNWITG